MNSNRRSATHYNTQWQMVNEVVQLLPKKYLPKRPAHAHKFVSNLLCCIMGLKESYLVCGFSISSQYACYTCREIYNVLLRKYDWRVACVDTRSTTEVDSCPDDVRLYKVIVLELNAMDVMVCNMNHFSSRYSWNLNCSDCLNVTSSNRGHKTVVVDVSAKPLTASDSSTIALTVSSGHSHSQYCGRVMSDRETQVMLSELKIVFQPLYAIVHSVLNTNINTKCQSSGGCELLDGSDRDNEHIVSFGIMDSSTAQSMSSSNHSVSVLPNSLSFPFLAGWLLGYPCVYHSCASIVNEDAGTNGLVECLCNRPLVKYSLLFRGNYGNSDEEECLLDFSVPQGLMNDRVEDSYTVKEHVEKCLNKEVERLRHLPASQYLTVSKSLRISKESVCLSCVTL